MGQKGTPEITGQTTEPQLRDVRFLHLPACRRKARFFVEVELTEVIWFCQPKAGTSWLLLHLGWCQQQLWEGCETLWASLTHHSSCWGRRGTDRSWIGCAGRGGGVLVSSPSARRLRGEGALNTVWRCEVAWAPWKLSPRARWGFEHFSPCCGVTLTSRHWPCSLQGSWNEVFWGSLPTQTVPWASFSPVQHQENLTSQLVLSHLLFKDKLLPVINYSFY